MDGAVFSTHCGTSFQTRSKWKGWQMNWRWLVNLKPELSMVYCTLNMVRHRWELWTITKKGKHLRKILARDELAWTQSWTAWWTKTWGGRPPPLILEKLAPPWTKRNIFLYPTCVNTNALTWNVSSTFEIMARKLHRKNMMTTTINIMVKPCWSFSSWRCLKYLKTNKLGIK